MYRMTSHTQDADPGGPAAPGQRRIQVRRSGVHGKGVYALRPIAAGQAIIEYKGELISWKEALRRHPRDPADPDHTFYFHIDERRVIDGGSGGNAARWINHACEPNCEAEELAGRVYVKALRAIAAGEELFFDYRLMLEGRHTPKVKQQYACHCGKPRCRGTMLAPKR
jgi:SET domain-containing protein